MFVRCSSVRPSGDCCDFCDICLYSLNIALHGTPLLLTEENQVLILEPSNFFIPTGILYRLFFSFFQKLQKSPRVVSGGKMRKREQKDSFPQCKNVQKYIFLETRAIDLRQIDVTEHHFLNSSTQEP